MPKLWCLSLGVLLAACVLAVTAVAQPAASDLTLVTIDSGAVRGVAAERVISFKGIPYAAPPVGELRWRVPQPVKRWDGVLPANEFGPACMQTDNVAKSEDCLTLNVWRPATPAAGPLPVMVWIYGGGLAHGGSAGYALDAMAAKGVVMVSFNYRLGRFGFFAHPALAAEAPGDVRGNYGYMDQLAALQWVKRNIAAFGGNPNQVTLFGESAGGGSVLVHLVSPMSRGLFQRAILESPGAPNPRAQVFPPRDLGTAETFAMNWAHAVGVSGEDAEALKQLRALPAQKLLDDGAETLKPAGMALPMIDGRFLPDRPDAIIAAGREPTLVPTIIGANDRDLPVGKAKTKEDVFALFGAAAAEARKLYDPLGDQTLEELKQQVFADRFFVEPARHFADEVAHAGAPVWLYRFAYVAQAQRGQHMGAPHSFEIPFVMDEPAALVGAEKVTPTDQVMADVVSGYWVQFGLTGDPNGGGRPVWPRHDPAVDRILHFTNSGVIVGTDPLKTRLDLWQRVWDGGQ